MDHLAVGSSLAATAPARAIEAFRPYLCVLARMHLDRRLWSKLDPEDLVQTTFQEALESGNNLLQNGDGELKALLRQMLLHNLWDALRRFQQQKRDVTLEQPLDQSSSRLMLSLEQSSPSQRAVKNEELEQLAEALLLLTEDQQEAVILHHLHEMKLTEVAEQTGRTIHATAGLIHRGLRKLQELLRERD
jgi:RNA polymerase sigma-70 factor (ECF subfamily)